MTQQRFTDKPFLTYCLSTVSAADGVLVKCSKCSKQAIVTREDYSAKHLKCYHCFHSETKGFFGYDLSAKGFCMKCERYIRIPIEDERKANYKEVHAPCPHCGTVQQWYVDKVQQQWYSLGEIHNGVESYFGCELFLLSQFRGHLVWALNYEHLDYLITFISADLRERPMSYRTQGSLIPSFMKTAKNRNDMLKVLRKMKDLT